MRDTIAAFAQADIPYACNNTSGIYETESGVRIGFVSVNEVYDGVTVETYVQSGIATPREQNVDLIFACCHWGEEMEHYPEEYQTELGHKYIDWGADLVVGCHPMCCRASNNIRENTLSTVWGISVSPATKNRKSRTP